MRCGCLPPCHPPKLEDHQPPLAYGIILAPVSLRPGIKVSRRGYQALLALKTKMPFEMTEDLKAADGKIFPYKPSRYFHQQNCLESNKINTSIQKFALSRHANVFWLCDKRNPFPGPQTCLWRFTPPQNAFKSKAVKSAYLHALKISQILKSLNRIYSYISLSCCLLKRKSP